MRTNMRWEKRENGIYKCQYMGWRFTIEELLNDDYATHRYLLSGGDIYKTYSTLQGAKRAARRWVNV